MQSHRPADGGQPGVLHRYEAMPAVTRLARACPPENILLDAPIESPNQLFETAARHIQHRYGLDAERIRTELMKREQLGSTGLGQGVALPHARVGGVGAAIGLFVRARVPFGFDAPDGKPIGEFLLLVMPEEDDREHLELLADAARFLGKRQFRLAARAARTPDEIAALMRATR
ncbi:PTS sugar transporter subunit IIA [Paraburkholderia sp. Se-20369]|nr:PTS sugar transporter subunit IIA [Paraburkholderia sp. Se-20369]TCW77395.1 PTS fructose transporter subunit IIA [Burkholderia sp. SRS-46]